MTLPANNPFIPNNDKPQTTRPRETVIFTKDQLNIVLLLPMAEIVCKLTDKRHMANPARHKVWKYGTLFNHLSEYNKTKIGLAHNIKMNIKGNVIYEIVIVRRLIIFCILFFSSCTSAYKG